MSDSGAPEDKKVCIFIVVQSSVLNVLLCRLSTLTSRWLALTVAKLVRERWTLLNVFCDLIHPWNYSLQDKKEHKLDEAHGGLCHKDWTGVEFT